MKVGITYEMPEWLQCLMGEIDTSIVMSLRKEDEQYVALKKELRELLDRHTVVAELLNGQKGVNLTGEEQEAFHEYMVIRAEIEHRERELFYYYGHKHCYEYMNRIGVVK